jgi:predicted nucleic acid-binding protein
MAAYFFDSSALVKRYVSEIGTNWVLQLTDPPAGNQIYVASITGVEVVSALARQAKAGNLSPVDLTVALALCRYDFSNEYVIVDLMPPVIQRAMAMAETHALRGYDAVQLAAAQEIHAERLALGLLTPTLISADAALNAAASVEGLPVDDPNAHP